MKMYEQIAKTIQEVTPGGELIPWDDAVLTAKCILKVMREPTDEMCEAAYWHQQSDVNAYQDAIDADLK